MNNRETQCLVIGSGIAGLSTALAAADRLPDRRADACRPDDDRGGGDAGEAGGWVCRAGRV